MLSRWRELHCTLLLCAQLIKPNKLLIIWLGSRPVGSRVYWTFGLISIVAVSCLFSTEMVYYVQHLWYMPVCFHAPERKEVLIDTYCWLRWKKREGEVKESPEQTRIIPAPDPLTQGAQHKCCNPPRSSPCLTLTKHLQDTMLLMSFPLPGITVRYLCNWLIMQPHHYGSVCLTQPSSATRSCLSVFFCLPWQDYLLSRG